MWTLIIITTVMEFGVGQSAAATSIGNVAGFANQTACVTAGNAVIARLRDQNRLDVYTLCVKSE